MKKNCPDSILKECEYCYKMVKELTEIEPETNGWAICNACLKKHFSEYHVTSCKEDYPNSILNDPDKADNYFQRLSDQGPLFTDRMPS